jgi:hypothetical protein
LATVVRIGAGTPSLREKGETMGKRCIGWILIPVIGVLTPGCLVRDVKQTVYVEPDGSATWTVLEDRVRSDGQTPTAREPEERDYFDAVQAGRHEAALALAKLDPLSLRTVMLRTDRPYAALIEARFARFDELMAAVALNLVDGARADSAFDRQRGVVTWTFTVSLEPRTTSETQDLSPLTDFFSGGTVLLAHGHFTNAVGFDLSADKRAATAHIMDVLLEDASRPEPFRFTLTWTEGEQ